MAQLQKYQRCALGKALFNGEMLLYSENLCKESKGGGGGRWLEGTVTWADSNPLLIPGPQSEREGSPYLLATTPGPDDLWLPVMERFFCQAVHFKVVGHSRPILTGLKVGVTLSHVVICLSLSGAGAFIFMVCSVLRGLNDRSMR